MINLSAIALSLLLLFSQPVILAMGQSNMYRAVPYIRELLPDADIINCAIPGSGITEWQPAGEYYGDCLNAAAGRQVTGVLFFQGERDARDEVLARQWSWKFRKYYTGIQLQYPDAPIIYAQIGPDMQSPDYPYWGDIQVQQRNAAARPGLRMIITRNIPTINSPHWGADGYRMIAARFVRALADQGIID